MGTGFHVTTIGEPVRLTGAPAIGGVPVTGTPSDGDTIVYDITTNTWVIETPPGSASASMVPTYIAPTETWNLPAYRQALWAVPIDCDGILDIDGVLVEVS